MGATTALPQSPGHPFYEAPEPAPGRCEVRRPVDAGASRTTRAAGGPAGAGDLLPDAAGGLLRGLDSQRGIAWRCSDSLSLQEFLGVEPGARCPTTRR